MVRNNFRFTFASGEHIQEYAKRINDEYESGEIGYYHLPKIGLDSVDEILAFEKGLKGIKNVVLVGIGGSSLGVKALRTMLSQRLAKRELFILDNPDPLSFQKLLDGINFDESIFIVSSKSGTTIETITLFRCLIDEFKPSDLSQNFIIITDSGSRLQKFGELNGIRVFNIPSNVGGRFSVLSAIGLVPLALCGYDVRAILQGAAQCKRQYIDEGDESLIAKAYHYASHRYTDTNVLFSYSDRFVEFNDWYIQLWAESLGKKKGYKRMGLTPVALVGPRDQHSFLQLIMDGPKNKTVTFLKIKDHGINRAIGAVRLQNLQECEFVDGLDLAQMMNRQADATAQSLVQEGVSVDVIDLDRLDEWHAGWLVFYYELLTSATGVMLGINTYDQPGVEIGKRIFKTMLIKDDLA